MGNHSPQRWQISELFIPLSVFLILVAYTYGILFVTPYSGFNFSNINGRIIGIYSQLEQPSSLQKGDLLVQVGPISWESYKRDSRQAFFKGTQPGEVVEITIQRDGTEMTIPWKYTGFDPAEFKTRFLNIWGLAFIFWFFGAAAELSIRPKDERRRLFIAANYLMALWLIFGSLSSYHLWGSSILLHAVTWLLMPVYLHLHWVFPHPLRRLPNTAWGLFYLTAFVFAFAEVTQSLPKSLYALIFLITLFGSIILQAVHFFRYKEQRSDVAFILASILVAFIPSIGFGFLVIIEAVPSLGPVSLFSLPFMSIAYFYVIYRRQLGGLEIRINRFISLYAFLILFGTALLILVIPITSLKINPEKWAFLIIVSTLLTAYGTTALFPKFQNFVETRFLGIKLPYQNLLETYSSRITTSTSLPGLLQLLDEEVFPSLLIRQFAFLQSSNGSLKTLLVKKISADALPVEDKVNDLVARSGKYIPFFSSADEWARLILPLKVGDNFIGFWLLGCRDPDDLYSLAEIPILQSIANQTATALSNILYAEQLRKMYQNDIERNELERKQLALDLHDSVLNELAVLRTNLDETNLTPQFNASYEDVIHRLREIVSDLRPPMLMYGLKPALDEFADNLMERSDDKVRVKADLEASEERLPEQMELHLYRIVQEACENSLRYANPRNISIYGSLSPQKVDLNIHDDGEGFDSESKLELDHLLANRHFGLAGMIERAYLIDARIKIQSSPSSGTRIHITWENNSDAS